jgi:hypothetical protein
MKPSQCTPPPSRAFQRDQEQDLKHPYLVDFICSTPKLLDRLKSEFKVETMEKLGGCGTLPNL